MSNFCILLILKKTNWQAGVLLLSDVAPLNDWIVAHWRPVPSRNISLQTALNCRHNVASSKLREDYL